MPTVDGGRIVVTLEGRDTNLSQLLTKIESQMQSGVASARNYDTTIAQISATQARNESATLAYAQSLARGAAATGDFAGAQRILGSALQQVTPNTTAASNAINQLQATINQAEVAQTKANSVFTNAAAGFNKLIGAYFAVSAAAQAFGSAIEAGNALEKQEVTLKALSGSTENYQRNLAAARAQQERFGGSLKDNIEGLSGFANLSNRTGIEIERLANLARGLATIDPVQGFKGAAVALKEFFSGDITSLARRFEIPREALNNIKGIADEAERFRALEVVLAKYGVTQELIAATASTTAVQYEKLGGAAQDALAAIGQGIAALGTGSGIVQDLTTKFQSMATGLTTLSQIGTKKLGVEQSILSASNSVDEFNAKIALTNQLIDQQATVKNAGILGALTLQTLKMRELTQAEFEFAKASSDSNVPLQQTQAILTGLNPSISDLELRFKTAGDQFGATRQELTNFEQAMFLASAASAEGATFAAALANAVLAGTISTEEATQKLQAYSIAIAENNARHQENQQATQLAAGSTAVLSTELGENAIKAAEASAATAQLKSLQEAIVNISGAVAAGHITAANGAATLAAQYAIASGEAQRLIGLQLQLAGLNNAGIATSARKRGQEGGLLGGGATPRDDKSFAAAQADLRFLEEQKRRQDALLQSDINLARAKGNTKQAVDLLRKSQQGLNKDSAEYKNIEAQIINLEDSAAKKGKKAAKSPKLTANEKINNNLLAQEEKFDNKMEDLERSHQAKLLDIITEFNKKQLETQKENEVLKRRSRFDFYTNLNTSTLAPIDKQKFAAAYEEAFAEAQRISQSGKAKLAQEFLELRKRQIEELQKLAQEEADISKDKDLSKKDKQAQLADLEARRKLLLDAQEEEKKQLLEGGDKNLNELNSRIADENKAYDEQATKIATAAERSADAKIAASERAKIKVSEENKELAKQVALFDDINAKNSGGSKILPSSTPNTPATTPSVPVDVTQPVPVKADTPLNVALPPLVTVQPSNGLFIVRDDGVIAAIGDQTVRLEGKLTELSNALSSMNTSLGGKLDGVRSAIGNVRLAKP